MSGLWHEGGALDSLDKRLSMPVFTLELPLPLEAALTVIGVWFGCPLLITTLLPLAAAALHDTLAFGLEREPGAFIAFLVVLAVALCFWVALARISSRRYPWSSSTSALSFAESVAREKGQRPLVPGFTFAYAPGRTRAAIVPAFVLPAHVALMIVYLVASPDAHHAAAFSTFAWILTVVCNEITKSKFKRRRPVVVGTDLASAAAASATADASSTASPLSSVGARDVAFRNQLLGTRRHFCELQLMLRAPSHSHGALPSGDSAGAAAAMTALLLVASAVTTKPLPTAAVVSAACIACSAAFGRVFFHAHHLLDVCVGLCVGTSLVCTIAQFTNVIGTFTWAKHVLLVQLMLTAMAVLPKFFKQRRKQ